MPLESPASDVRLFRHSDLTLDQSQHVPNGVFDCKSPASDASKNDDSSSSSTIRMTLEEQQPVEDVL